MRVRGAEELQELCRSLGISLVFGADDTVALYTGKTVRVIEPCPRMYVTISDDELARDFPSIYEGGIPIREPGPACIEALVSLLNLNDEEIVEHGVSVAALEERTRQLFESVREHADRMWARTGTLEPRSER